MNVAELLKKGILRVASKPPANWPDSESATLLTVPLLAGDYPAKTAVMWNAAYAKFGLQDRNMMVVADPKDAERILEVFRADPKYRGGGAGVGFKEKIIPFLDEVTPLAKAMGAVNIVKKMDDGRLAGDNTDGVGYARSLADALTRAGKQLDGSSIGMLGAGGSARGIAFALADAGAHLIIANRTKEKAAELAAVLNEHFKSGVAFGGGRELISSMLGKVDAIVSVIDDEKSPLDAYSTIGEMVLPVTPESIEHNRLTTEKLLWDIDRSVVISDIRIRKGPTAMLAQAKELGFGTLDGIPMVINQGVAAFLWLYGGSVTKREDVESCMRRAAGS